MSSGRNSSERPVSARNQSPALGSSAISSFDSSSRIRSALTISSRCRSDSTAATSSGVGLELELRDEARRAQHAQRVVDERDLGGERRAQPPRREVGGTAERIDELGVGQSDRHRVDGEVAAREIRLEVVGERDLGLAALGSVDLGAEGGDLDPHAVLLAADGAEPLSLEPHVVCPRAHDALDHVRARVGGDVDVFRRPIEQRVAHAAAHQVALVTGLGEAARASCCTGDAGSRYARNRAGASVTPSILAGCRRARRKLLRWPSTSAPVTAPGSDTLQA